MDLLIVGTFNSKPRFCTFGLKDNKNCLYYNTKIHKDTYRQKSEGIMEIFSFWVQPVTEQAEHNFAIYTHIKSL